MAVTRKKPEPSFEPPPARLFLDDLEEVVRIFREAANYQLWEGPPEEQEPKLSLSVKDVVCDRVEDLPKIGKKTTELEIKLRKRSGCELGLLIWPTYTRVWVMGIKEEGGWLVYGKLQAIYQKRRVRWKDWVCRIPWWVFVGLFLIGS